jgi:hypothetical protein
VEWVEGLVQADVGADALSEKVIGPSDMAAKLFNAQRALCDVQDEIEQKLISAGILPPGWDDWWHDHYDTSIEIKGVPADFVLTDEHLMTLHDMGFSRVWTHADGGGRYYSTKPRASASTGSLNFSNEAESDPVSLNQPSSSQPKPGKE